MIRVAFIIVFGAKGIVPVVCSIVLSKGMPPDPTI